MPAHAARLCRFALAAQNGRHACWKCTSCEESWSQSYQGQAKNSRPAVKALRNAAGRAIMRAVVQRVSRAKVSVDGRVTGEIGAGLMILLGVGRNDTSAVVARMAERCANLRIFEDEQGKMNRSLLDVKGSALAVSQFTLYGDARGQRRPSFITAAPPELAKTVYEEFCEALRKLGVTVATGIFQAMMSVELVNEGPVTILLDSDNTF
jgi:D-aminoacyl-tRNA deacylase